MQVSALLDAAIRTLRLTILFPMLYAPLAAAQSAQALLAGDAPRVEVAGERLWTTPILRALFADPARAPHWRDEQLAVMRELIARAYDEGLDPRDYLDGRMADAAALPPGERDVLATEALARLAFTLRFGKCNPEALDPDWNYTRSFGTTDPVDWMREAIASNDLAARVEALRPDTPHYRVVQAALKRYREFVVHGGWPGVDKGATLRPGMDDDRAPQLRRRLAVTGEWERSDETLDERRYDEALVKAVKIFQAHHGLDTDGAVGRATTAALNQTAEVRVTQLRVNLERLRWLSAELGAGTLVVNVAAFHGNYIEGGEVRWSGRVVVGRPDRKTPIFKARLSSIELNPTWTVPPTILKEDILPKLRAGSHVLEEKQLRLLDSAGRPVDAASIDWKGLRPGHFGYVLRGEPGPKNPLGQVAFLFPNPHDVYLHDTPQREVFVREDRALSSGCIRVEHPLLLAARLLDDPEHWDEKALKDAVATGKTRHVALPRAVTVMLVYLTAFADDDETIQFRRDVYGFDEPVRAALDAPLRLSLPKDVATAAPAGA
ncbi:MAG: L,D-transpeptidase family protein [Gammaproteobacteria bacterium]|nr:L,D-transpeptidase family protein [Gammaproteobacteria bacterium]